MDESNAEVIIIGAGLSGLACASILERCGVNYILLEASDAVGGRMKTDEHRGFLLDRGFQVMLNSYPECSKFLDFDKLDLRAYKPGALVRFRGKLHRVVDPWRDPISAIGTACSPVGTLADKLQLAQMRQSLLSQPPGNLLSRQESTTLDALKARGFSDSMIESFFRPFFGGIFLEKDLSTSSRLFDYLFSMFSTGDACVPARGMQEIPKQIASKLNPSRLHFNTKVERVFGNTVMTNRGEQFRARDIVIAVEANRVSEILTGTTTARSGRSVTCMYFAAESPPLAEAILILNAEGSGPVNNFCVPSAVSRHYAPEGKSLLSATILGIPELDEESLEMSVRSQMSDWFGKQAKNWDLLRSYRIQNALPAQELPTRNAQERSYKLKDGLFICGDHTNTASINGALESGRMVGELIAQRVPARV